MVDAVITWVDGSDEKLRAKREKYLAAINKRLLRNGASAATRWHDNDELAYCIRLIRKNARWIGQIFLVTDQQVPHWLTPARAAEFGVAVVDHQVLFADAPECLPTFNSSSIEYALHNIPGLSEQFLYFNDDIFVIRPLHREAVFGPDFALARGAVMWKNRTAASVASFLTGKIRERAGVIRYRGGDANSLSATRVFRRAHAPYPLLRSRLQALFPPRRIAEMARYRFRAKEQLNPIDLFFNVGMRAGYVRLGPRDNAYLDPTEASASQLLALLARVRAAAGLKTLCAQSWDLMAAPVREQTVAFLEARLAA